MKKRNISEKNSLENFSRIFVRESMSDSVIRKSFSGNKFYLNSYERANLKTGVSKDAKFSEIRIFLTLLIRTRTSAYQGVRNVCFSKNLT